MSSPIQDSLATSRPSPAQQPGYRERVENALSHLTSGDSDSAEPGRNDLVKPVQRINEVLRPYDVRFELSEEDSRVITKVIDNKSGELIRQIPSQAVLEISRRLHELSGLLLRESI